MIGSIGSRLRLVLHQPGGGPVPADTVVPSSLPEIEFVAYAADGGPIEADASPAMTSGGLGRPTH